MFEIMSVVTPDIKWDAFLATAKQALGRSLTRELDGSFVRPMTTAGLLAVLGEMRNPGGRPEEVVREAGSLLRHASYSFLLVSTSELLTQILMETPLHVTSAPAQVAGFRLSVVTGNLSQWRETVICATSADFALRMFVCRVINYFESVGLGSLWFDYSKKPMSDGTFALIHK